MFRAAGLAARDVVRAQAPLDPHTGADAALAKAREQLDRRLAKAVHRGICAAPIDIDAIWDFTRRFGADLSLVVSPVGLTGTWTLTGEPVAGRCADDTPEFADVLEIVQDTSLHATASLADYGGDVDGDGFYLYAVYGAIGCDGGLYDLDLEITGKQLTPSTYQVVQRYVHADINRPGECPVCDVTWVGTMTRAPDSKKARQRFPS
jgi:hypothetical protein